MKIKFKDLSSTIIKEIQEVFNRIDNKKLEEFMQEIIKAEKIILIGVGREGISTRAFAMRLMHLGKESHWVWDDTTPGLEEGDLLIATSGSGEIGHIHYVVNEAKRVGARVALVTGVPDRKTAQLADVVLWVPASVYHGKDNVVPSIQPMGNLFEQSLFILYDLIVLLLMKKMNIQGNEMEKRHRNIE
jgi:6-phospho-3-hexuloisomerase